MRRLALALCALLLLTGCSTPIITLRHPDGRTVACGNSYTFGYGGAFVSAERDRACVADYQRQGFERVPN
jgi:hypothetical protein